MPTTNQRSVGKVTANVAIDENPGEPAEDGSGEENASLQFLDYRHQHVKERLLTATDPEEQKALLDQDQMLEAKFDFIKNQMRSGGLKEQYFPRSRCLLVPTSCNWTCIKTP